VDSRTLVLASVAGIAGLGLVRARSGGSRAVAPALPVVSILHAQDTRPCFDDDPVPGMEDLAWVGTLGSNRPGGARFVTVDLVQVSHPVRWARIVAWESSEIAEGRCGDLLERLRGATPGSPGRTPGHTWSVMNSYLDPRLENQGLGRDGYLAVLVFLMAHANMARILFSNDGCGGAGTSVAALRVWNGLCRDFPHAREDRRHHERVVIAASYEHPLLRPRIEAFWKNKGRLPGAGSAGSARRGSRQALPVAFPTGAAAQAAALSVRDAVTATPAFQEWFGGSDVVEPGSRRPQICYHGTTGNDHGPDFDVFHDDVPDRGGLRAFFATEPRFAEGYAGRVTSGGVPVRPRVYPVYLSIQDVFDFRKHWRLAKHFYEETGGIQDPYEVRRILMGQREDDGSISDIANEVEDIDDRRFTAKDLTQAMFVRSVRQGSWDALEAGEFVEWLRQGGHDGIVLLEDGSVNYGIFEPGQVKSATGNAGTFDRDEPKISANRRSKRLPRRGRR